MPNDRAVSPHHKAVRASTSLVAMSLALFLNAPALAQQASGAAQEPDISEPIVVTGSRIARSGFDTPTPVAMVGAEQIGRQGVSTVADVLNEIPAFRPQATASTTAIYMNNIGASTADLRGLGANRTLVLIDGRRVVPATVAGGGFALANTVDLNMVPTSLIERAEVVTGGASSVYGSDAVAGVVNLILDTDLQGLRASAQWGTAEEGDDEEWVLSLAGGTSFAGGLGRFVAGVEYVDDQGTGGCYSRDWCALSYNTVSNPFINSSNEALGRVAAGQAATLILPHARTATSTNNGIIAFGPLRGTEFLQDGSIVQHDYGQYYGAGIFQSGGGDDQLAFYQNYPLSSPSERINAFAHAEFDVTDAVTLFAEGSYGRVEGSTRGAQRRDLVTSPTSGILVQRTNPFLPDAVGSLMDANGLTSIRIGRVWNDIGPQVGSVTRETYRGVGGLEAEFGNGWTLDAYYQYGRTDYSQVGRNTTVNSRMAFALDAVADPISGAPVCAATLAGNPLATGCVALNPFGQGSPSAAAMAYVTDTARQTTQLTQHVAALSVQGDLVDLWAGPLAVATGVEFRQDQAEGTADAISRALDFYTSPGNPIDGKIEVWEGFLEAVLPVFDGAELNGAVRLTDYSTSGSVTTWKVGADWQPLDWLRLRATRSRDIRAPNVFELFGPPQSSFQSILDPQTGAQVLSPVLIGGNASLVPEIADTWTAGIVLEPDLGPGRLRLSVDYYDIELDGAVSTLGAQVIVNRCHQGAADLCQLVTRDAGNAITQVRNFNLNLNTLVTRGWDLEASYTVPMSELAPDANGDFSVRVLSTIVDDLITTDPSGRSVDRAGMNGSPVSQPSGVPRYVVNTYFTYTNDPFSAQLQVRHISGGRYNTELIGPDEDGYSPLLANSINDNAMDSRTYVNVNASYRLWSDGDRNAELFGVINNAFDKAPPVDAPSSFGPTNNVLYDVVGRSYKVGVRVRY